MSSALLRPQTNKRSPSRSGDESPSSVITVQHVPSNSATRQGSRYPAPSSVNHRSQLSVEQPGSYTEKHKRRASHNSIGGFAEGVGNLNRWSQSTASSKASATNQRRSSFARRLSGSFGSIGSFATQQSPQKPHGFRLNLSPTRGGNTMDPKSGAETHRVDQSGRLPSAATLASLSQAVDAAKTPLSNEPSTPGTAELLPTATYMPGNGDYFGQAWGGHSPGKSQRPLVPSSGAAAYLTSPATDRINPGAKNSFASSSPSRAGYPREYANQSGFGPRDLNLSPRPGHSRQVNQGSSDNEHGSTSMAGAYGGGYGRKRKTPSQKAMLAKALEKANHAVVLDNAQNFEGAMTAYTEACSLLEQVMIRSSGDEDKHKLETIRSTYKARIQELQTTELGSHPALKEKALPEVPKSTVETPPLEPFSVVSDDDDDEQERQYAVTQERAPSRMLTRDQIPPRRTSLMPRNKSFDDADTTGPSMSLRQPQMTENEPVIQTTLLSVPVEKPYMPPPLSPRRTNSPGKAPPTRENSRSPNPQADTYQPGHSRQETAESTSWLDTIDESGGSSNSSVHSRSSFKGVRRKHLRTGSGGTEAEFDAALDAAVEAAYDEGYEPADDFAEDMDYGQPLSFGFDRDSTISSVQRNVEIARQRVRDAEREQALAFGEEYDPRKFGRDSDLLKSNPLAYHYEDEDAEHEEAVLDELTKDLVTDDRDPDFSNKRAVPRESDSSGFSGRTWGSSVGSMPTATNSITPLSTVAESAKLLSINALVEAQYDNSAQPVKTSGPRVPVNSRIDLPPLPKLPPPGPPPAVPSALASPGVRERRLSGQKQFKQLKIDTSAKLPNGMAAPKTQPASRLGSLGQNKLDEAPKSAMLVRDGQLDPPLSASKSTFLMNPGSARQISSPFPQGSPSEPMSGVSDGAANTARPLQTSDVPLPGSPVRTATKGSGILRKNFSSSSLRSLRQGLPTPPAEESPQTPMSRVFSGSSSLQRTGTIPSLPDLPTPSIANFAKAGNTTGNLSFFDTDIHSPEVQGTPNPLIPNGPAPLEPCPEPLLLRPFWLMRAIYQTIVNPRGGYVSSRLFVPRDIWRVRNVKLKYVEDKVAACDLLTAALLNLTKVDNFDVDKVLEQVQAFELTLDSVQGQLGKKLGAEVGAQGVLALLRLTPAADEPLTASDSRTSGARSYFGLKKLSRSKPSYGPGLPSAVAGVVAKEPADNFTMKSVPMTPMTNPRFAKRDKSKILGIGPHAHYMAALARLCDAVQVIDQIARQVEDPGLKFSSKSHVGLELSMRHAAEFFAFYICRFALADIGMMLDKFVKRGSEWVSQ